MLHIAIDARRIRDFGIGTYIRSLVHGLAQVDRRNRYTIVSGPADVRTLAGLPESFETAIYSRSGRDLHRMCSLRVTSRRKLLQATFIRWSWSSRTATTLPELLKGRRRWFGISP